MFFGHADWEGLGRTWLARLLEESLAKAQRTQRFSYNKFYSLSAKLVPQAAKSAKGWRDVYVHCRVKGHVHFIILAAFSNPHGPIIFVSCRYHASFAERWLAFSDEGNGWL